MTRKARRSLLLLSTYINVTFCKGPQQTFQLDQAFGESAYQIDPNTQPIDAPGLFFHTVNGFSSKPSKTKHLSPFDSYHRFSGAISQSQLIHIDFDLNHYTWRVISSTKAETPSIRNGTWSPTSKNSPHAYFPELDLVVTNFHYFNRRCNFQPFLTVFRTDGMDDASRIKQSNEEWSPVSKDNVVMRTASFRLPRALWRLEVCARMEDYEVEGKEGLMGGLHDDVVVPLGLIAATRYQMVMEEKLDGNCG